MFSGIIEETGRLSERKGGGSSLRIRLEAPGIAGQLSPGDSVSVDGACLTVERTDDTGFTVYSSPETLARTTLAKMAPGSPVNLERALAASGRLDGHIVQGHVDGTGNFLKAEKAADSWRMSFRLSTELLECCVEKGSIAVNGVSLTIASMKNDEGVIEIAVIPFTYEHTTLKDLKPGDPVNVETDIIGKYVRKFLEPHKGKSGLTAKFLKDAGF